MRWRKSSGSLRHALVFLKIGDRRRARRVARKQRAARTKRQNLGLRDRSAMDGSRLDPLADAAILPWASPVNRGLARRSAPAPAAQPCSGAACGRWHRGGPIEAAMDSSRFRRRTVALVAAYAVALQALLLAFVPLAPTVLADPFAMLCSHMTRPAAPASRPSTICPAQPSAPPWGTASPVRCRPAAVSRLRRRKSYGRRPARRLGAAADRARRPACAARAAARLIVDGLVCSPRTRI